MPVYPSALPGTLFFLLGLARVLRRTADPLYTNAKMSVTSAIILLMTIAPLVAQTTEIWVGATCDGRPLRLTLEPGTLVGITFQFSVTGCGGGQAGTLAFSGSRAAIDGDQFKFVGRAGTICGDVEATVDGTLKADNEASGQIRLTARRAVSLTPNSTLSWTATRPNFPNDAPSIVSTADGGAFAGLIAPGSWITVRGFGLSRGDRKSVV